LGRFPYVPVENAWARRRPARRLLEAGADPAGQKQALRRISVDSRDGWYVVSRLGESATASRGCPKSDRGGRSCPTSQARWPKSTLLRAPAAFPTTNRHLPIANGDVTRMLTGWRPACGAKALTIVYMRRTNRSGCVALPAADLIARTAPACRSPRYRAVRPAPQAWIAPLAIIRLTNQRWIGLEPAWIVA
jgi:hypothetical protein